MANGNSAEVAAGQDLVRAKFTQSSENAAECKEHQENYILKMKRCQNAGKIMPVEKTFVTITPASTQQLLSLVPKTNPSDCCRGLRTLLN